MSADASDPEQSPTLAGIRELRLLDGVNDVIVAFDATLTITYANAFAGRLLDTPPDVLVGSSIVDRLHPDDLVRAAEVTSMIADAELGREITPAVYRVLHADGRWVPIEMVGLPLPPDLAELGDLMIIGRYSGDHDIQNRILESLTSGEPFHEVIALAPGFGRWRHPGDAYAVQYVDDEGQLVSTGTPSAVALAEQFGGDDVPWVRSRREGVELIADLADLPDDLAAAADAVGLVRCMVIPVGGSDAATSHATAIAWSGRHGVAASVHRFALERMAGAADLVMQWRANQIDLERAARYDPLTGLANRASLFAAFRAAVSSAAAATSPLLAVLYVDLDRFKEVNDRFGHAVGDEALVVAADRLRAAVRRDDLPARVGGDEFVVLVRDLVSVAEAEAMAERIVRAFDEPILTSAGVRAEVGASVGLVVAPASAARADELIAEADAALYEAKAAGRRAWRRAAPA